MVRRYLFDLYNAGLVASLPRGNRQDSRRGGGAIRALKADVAEHDFDLA